jgi:glycosyltransferase involved in cell wall biosynthesis
VKVAYLDVRYDEVGKTFVRSEVERVRELGIEVIPFSLRFAGVDEQANPEAEVLVDGQLLRAAMTLARFAFRHPVRVGSGAALAIRSTAPGARGRVRALVHLAVAACLADRVRRDGIDHVHAHALWAAGVAMLTSQLAKVPYSFTTHGPPEFDGPGIAGIQHKVSRASFVASISFAVRAELFRHIEPSGWHKVAIVRCGVDPSFLSETSVPPPSAPRLVCVARLDDRKAQPLLLRAVQRVATTRAVELVLVGDGPSRARLEEMVGTEGLRDRVRFAGWQGPAGVRRELLAARALVLPSFAEGLPVAIMESLSCRRPVIAARVGAVEELVEPGLSGWLVTPTSEDAIVDAIHAVLDADPERLARMGEAGARRVRERHDGRSQAASLVAAFRRAVTT